MDKELIKQAIDHIEGLRTEVAAQQQVLQLIADGLLDPADGLEKVAAILSGEAPLPNRLTIGQRIDSTEVVTTPETASPEDNLWSNLNRL